MSNRFRLIWEWIVLRDLNRELYQNSVDSPIAIWGAGREGCELYEFLIENGWKNIIAFLDIDPQKHEKQNYNIEIVEPYYFLKNHRNVKIILALGMFSAAIYFKLQKQGFRNVFTYSQFLLDLRYSEFNILEIGPLNNPVFIKREKDHIKYFDVLSSRELAKKALSWGISKKGVPPYIDFVSKSGDLSIINEKFTYIFSSHVIEHQPDFIRHLQKVYELLKYNGKYVLIVPDRRFCFDYYRNNSKVADVLSAYYEGYKVHNINTLISGCYRTHNNPTQHWKGMHGKIPLIERDVLEEMIDYYKNNFDTYIDGHAWTFTPKSFEEILNELNRLNLVHLKIERIYNTELNKLEFSVVLQK